MHDLKRQGSGVNEIARTLGVRKATIIGWLKQTEYTEGRGWQKGVPRNEAHTDFMAERIRALKQKRIEESKYFVGSEYVQMDYAAAYPAEPVPSIWHIDKVVREAKLQTRQPKPARARGGSKYLLYPIESIKRIGTVHESADFIGRKYITGRTEPINILSTAYYAPFKLFQIRRIQAEKSLYVIGVLKEQWQTYPIPDVFRVDNGLQFRGSGSGKRSLSQFLVFLLNLNIIPLFGSPAKPWTNPHIEGHNRVFNEKIWSRTYFTGLEQIDHECERFNEESRELFRYRYAPIVFNQYLDLVTNHSWNYQTLESVERKKIYFIRFVESPEKHAPGTITVLNELIILPEKYTHQFVFVEWNLETERLSIYSEFERVATLIEQQSFKLNM